MNRWLGEFERIVRASPAAQVVAAARVTEAADIADPTQEPQHPFDTRNIHPDLPRRVRSLFDDGYLPESVLTAFKYLESEVKRISGIKGKTGVQLMGAAFGGESPAIVLNPGVTESDQDERRGYRDLFTGAVAGIRNPRGHEVFVPDTPDEALDYLALASLLLRKLDAAGLR